MWDPHTVRRPCRIQSKHEYVVGGGGGGGGGAGAGGVGHLFTYILCAHTHTHTAIMSASSANHIINVYYALIQSRYY